MMIINVCGANGVGKTTTANIISYELGLLGNTTKVLHLADKVKELASQILGESIELYYDRYTKDEIIPKLGFSRRQLLCNITDSMIQYVSRDYWWEQIDYYFTYDYVIIPDCRYEAWLDFLVKKQHTFINMLVVNCDSDLSTFKYLNKYTLIDNDGSKEQLHCNVKEVLRSCLVV